MRSLIHYVTLAWFAVFASTTYAAVIDQNQPNSPDLMATFAQQQLAQSFKQTNSNIAGAGIFLQDDFGSSDTVTISLWDKIPTQAGANQLASASGTATSGSWFDVFWTPVAINPLTTYYLVFSSVNNSLAITGDTSNPYADGQVYASGYSSFPNYDYTFRTYFEPTQASVPEPISAYLILLGLAGIGVIKLRRSV